MKLLKPSIKIVSQTQLTTPTNSDDTIMNDTVVLMDDPNALMGGPTKITSTPRTKIKSIKPPVSIKIRH